jgi:hypothetical protein
MKKISLLLILFLIELSSRELVVVGDKNFPENNLTRSEIKAIFLNKKRFIENEKILVMNHKVNHPLRLCFEKEILGKTERILERYWRKAYYKGKRPPKVVSSTKMLFLYLDSVHPAIGYSDANATLNTELIILYRVSCAN